MSTFIHGRIGGLRCFALAQRIDHQAGFATALPWPIFKSQRTSMGFRDLATQKKTDSRTAWFGCEKRYEQIRGV